MKQVAIIDYGMCNLGSVRRAFQECGGDPVVTSDPKDLERAAYLVLPGVGNFTDAMHNIRELGLEEPIREQAMEGHIPLLGICLGMQLLAEWGEEGGETRGLGLVPGRVQKLKPETPDTRIPHVGWNEVYPTSPSPIFDSIPPGKDFYFVHSYHFTPSDEELVLARTPYCGKIVTAVSRANVFGMQFHPEKSQRPGFQLIRNFLEL